MIILLSIYYYGMSATFIVFAFLFFGPFSHSTRARMEMLYSSLERRGVNVKLSTYITAVGIAFVFLWPFTLYYTIQAVKNSGKK